MTDKTRTESMTLHMRKSGEWAAMGKRQSEREIGGGVKIELVVWTNEWMSSVIFRKEVCASML